MSELFIEDYLKKITLLEKQIGAKTIYPILESFSINSRDILALQKAAKTIAEFVGLSGLTFIIAIVKQKEKVGGHVELKYVEKEVFVEISDDVADFENIVIATLAHEITHKYMHLNGISCGMGLIHKYENEVFTDITSVFFGLGKLMLNGRVEFEKTYLEKRTDGNYYVTKTLKSGYLDLKQLAFVYRIVCAMRGISKLDMLSNLSTTAEYAIRACDCYYRDYFHPRFRTEEFINERIQIAMEDIRNLQYELNQAEQLLRFLQEKCIHKTKRVLEAKHEEITSFQNDLESVRHSEIYDPCLIFLEGIQSGKRISQIRARVSQDISDIVKVRKNLNKLKRIVQK